MTRLHAAQVPAFAGLVALAAAVALYLAPRVAEMPAGGVVALGMVVDWLVVLPLAFYGLVARPRGQGLTVLPVALGGWLFLRWVLPQDFHSTLDPFVMWLPALECVVLGWIVAQVWAFRRAQRAERLAETDLWRATRRAIDLALPNYRLPAQVLAFEALVLYYAGWAWRSPVVDPLPTPSPRFFTLHRRSGYGLLLGGLGLVVLCELPLVHLLLDHYVSPAAAWIATALGLYGCLFFGADWVAARRRFLELGPEGLEVRVGLRWDFHVPYRQIVAVQELAPGREPVGPALAVMLCGRAEVEIELAEIVVAHGAYGLRRPTQKLRLRVDDRPAFVAALRARLLPRAEIAT